MQTKGHILNPNFTIKTFVNYCINNLVKSSNISMLIAVNKWRCLDQFRGDSMFCLLLIVNRCYQEWIFCCFYTTNWFILNLCRFMTKILLFSSREDANRGSQNLYLSLAVLQCQQILHKKFRKFFYILNLPNGII